MKLQFKHQKFQADAAIAVCDVFAGQPYLTPNYLIDKGYRSDGQLTTYDRDGFTGWNNQPLIPQLNDARILENINKIQRENQIAPSRNLEKIDQSFNLTIEMETGVGKTYTYIKTIYELNKRYGWSKFIVIVPSVAIREGVYKSFQLTEDHFSEDYGKKIRYFIYNSAKLTDIEQFASDSSINVMIINSQAFNATGKDARRIYMNLDSFRSRRPIDVIAKTNPILIIDEPQSVEGTKTKEKLKEFNPFLTLRYSATHKKDSFYNLIYRLDAMEAYNKKLVKKIAVKGLTTMSDTATEGYVYLQNIHLSANKQPMASIEFDVKGKSGIRKVVRKVTPGYNLFEHSNKLEEYNEGYTVTGIDGRDNSLSFVNGKKIFVGELIGAINEEHIRRIQIRETILSHIDREKQLFYKNIKVLSLFFIDEVAKYKQYDEAGVPFNGIYANIFEEEYRNIVDNMQLEFGNDEFYKYLQGIDVRTTHSGYFSIDKNKKTGKERLIDSKKERGSDISGDSDAYDLIMKDKERLLDRKEPVRFIFSHSALREGWDNPNVFQICTLKQSGSEVRKRQEVGRGLRLSVNQSGERMDVALLGEDVHNYNVLTVIASESYDSFAKGLQTELAEAVSDRPVKVTQDLFKNRVVKDASGAEQTVDGELALLIFEDLISEGYTRKGVLTDKFYEDKKTGTLNLSPELAEYNDSIIEILDTVYNPSLMLPDNARANNVTLEIDNNKLSKKEFQALWNRINIKSAYTVKFDTKELVEKAIDALNKKLRVSKITIKIERGELKEIKSKEDLLNGSSFAVKESKQEYSAFDSNINHSIKYDLVGKLVEETELTRKAIVGILKGIEKAVFSQFGDNPEEFILKASNLINEEKATVIIQHIAYNKLDEIYDTTVFTEPTLKGKLGTNAMLANKHLYDHIIYDSSVEKTFAEKLDASTEVAVYVKLPNGFYIPTPVGKYNPDWAIAFNEGHIKHIYFVAETKGSMSSMELRKIEEARIDCARRHFEAISSDKVKYDVVDSYDNLMNIVMR